MQYTLRKHIYKLYLGILCILPVACFHQQPLACDDDKCMCDKEDNRTTISSASIQEDNTQKTAPENKETMSETAEIDCPSSQELLKQVLEKRYRNYRTTYKYLRETCQKHDITIEYLTEYLIIYLKEAPSRISKNHEEAKGLGQILSQKSLKELETSSNPIATRMARRLKPQTVEKLKEAKIAAEGKYIKSILQLIWEDSTQQFLKQKIDQALEG